MKKILGMAVVALAVVANAEVWAFDLVGAASKIQEAADNANAKIEEAQAKKDAKTLEKIEKIKEKIAELKEKIKNWQASGNVDSSETQTAIANAKASIEALTENLKTLSK